MRSEPFTSRSDVTFLFHIPLLYIADVSNWNNLPVIGKYHCFIFLARMMFKTILSFWVSLRSINVHVTLIPTRCSEEKTVEPNFLTLHIYIFPLTFEFHSFTIFSFLFFVRIQTENIRLSTFLYNEVLLLLWTDWMLVSPKMNMLKHQFPLWWYLEMESLGGN